ncbi:hypothetical protein DDE82_002983 [Stemphylium lycopersici]|nr:hypothetical protein DDE82_002983 [Stemphylium lycopersici]
MASRDYAEQLIDYDAAVRDTNLALHKHEDKTLIWTREADSIEKDGKPKYKPGNAVRSEFMEQAYASMVSYIVPAHVKGFTKAAKIAVPDMNPPPMLMPPQEVEALNKLEQLRRPDKKDCLTYDKLTPVTKNGLKLFLDTEDGVVTWDNDDPYVWENDYVEPTRRNVQLRRRAQSVTTYRTDVFDRDVVAADLVQTAYAHVAEKQAESLRTGKANEPTEREVMIEYHKFIAGRPHLLNKTGQVTKKGLSVIRLWFRYHNGWLLSLPKVKSIVHGSAQLVSTGLIPYTVYQKGVDMAMEAVEDDRKTLPSRNKKDGKPDQDAERKARQAARADAFKRIAPPQKNAHTIVVDEPFKQNEESTARITIRQDPYVKSFLQIAHRVNYIDDTVPDTQPQLRGDVYLTHRNTTKTQSLEYIPAHHIYDVTNPVWHKALRKLFPQANDHKDYWQDLHMSAKVSEQRLILIAMKHNDAPYTNNIRTRNDNVSALLKDIRIAICNSPMVFMLVRGSWVPKEIEELVQSWQNLATYDPLIEFFEDPQNPYINHNGVKKTGYPLFRTPAMWAFEDWNELARPVGIGALFEQREFMGEHEYDGLVAVVPVPGTSHNITGIFMSYHLQVKVAYTHDTPKLVPGDALSIDFGTDSDVVSEHPWQGTVTGPTKATPPGMLNVIAERPWKDGQALDTKVYNVIDREHLNQINARELQEWARNNCVVPVKITSTGDYKECKRLMSNISQMKVPHALREQYIEKDKRLTAQRNLLLMKEHTQAEATSLYQDVRRSQLQQALPIIEPMLLPHQREQYDKWRSDGVYARTSWLTGPSGSGKSYMAYVLVMPYLLDIRVSNRVIATLEHEEAVALQDKAQSNFDAGEDTYTWEAGRITYCAMQNDAVDECYRKIKPIAHKFMSDMSQPPRLVLRLHSKQAEINAVKAMIRPSYDRNDGTMPFRLDPDHAVTKPLPKSLLDAYLAKFRGSGHANIRDKRMKELDGSPARYIMELARFPGFPVSPELAATFSTDALEDLAETLGPIVEAHRDMRAIGDKMTKDLATDIVKAVSKALDALLRNAAVVCTTASVATQYAFNLSRKSHVVVLEEAGRANDAETMGFMSHFWSVAWRLIAGATNQLSPMAFGDSKHNPFQRQIVMSTITRYEVTGGDVARLAKSSRFQNPQLMQLAALVNDMPNLEPIYGYDEDTTRLYADINRQLWGINTPLLFINVEKSNPQRDANRSTYSLETAAATMRDAVLRMQHISGKNHTILTPYNAQVLLLQRERDFAVEMAELRGNHQLAKNLLHIFITTVDAFMGQDSLSVTLDTAGAMGHLFQTGRTVVACTRAKASFQIIGPSLEFTAARAKQHSGLVKLIYALNKSRSIRRVTRQEMLEFEQYHPTLEDIGLAIAGNEVKAKHTPNASILTAQLRQKLEHKQD